MLSVPLVSAGCPLGAPRQQALSCVPCLPAVNQLHFIPVDLGSPIVHCAVADPYVVLLSAEGQLTMFVLKSDTYGGRTHRLSLQKPPLQHVSATATWPAGCRWRCWHRKPNPRGAAGTKKPPRGSVGGAAGTKEPPKGVLVVLVAPKSHPKRCQWHWWYQTTTQRGVSGTGGAKPPPQRGVGGAGSTEAPPRGGVGDIGGTKKTIKGV